MSNSNFPPKIQQNRIARMNLILEHPENFNQDDMNWANQLAVEIATPPSPESPTPVKSSAV